MEDTHEENLFKDELSTFESRKAELLRSSIGHYVLIKGHELVGTYTSFELAYTEGVTKFGVEPFLIKKVESDDQAPSMPALSCGLLGI